MTSTLLGLIVLALDIWAIMLTLQSNVSILNKVLWIAIILFLPVIGLIAWYFMGPGRR